MSQNKRLNLLFGKWNCVTDISVCAINITDSTLDMINQTKLIVIPTNGFILSSTILVWKIKYNMSDMYYFFNMRYVNVFCYMWRYPQRSMSGLCALEMMMVNINSSFLTVTESHEYENLVNIQNMRGPEPMTVVSPVMGWGREEGYNRVMYMARRNTRPFAGLTRFTKEIFGYNFFTNTHSISNMTKFLK